MRKSNVFRKRFFATLNNKSMVINKVVTQKMELLKRVQPDLYASINAHLKELSEEDKGKVAGLIIEYVLQSGGNPDIFIDDELSDDGKDTLLTSFEELREEL